MITPWLMALLISVCALTYSFEIVFGLAGTIMMLPVLGFFFESKTLVVYSLLPQLLVAGIAILKSRQKLNFRLLISMLAMAALGGLLGGYFFIHIPQALFRRILGAVIVLSGIFLIPILFFADRLHFKLNDAIFKKVVAWIILLCGVVYLIRP